MAAFEIPDDYDELMNLVLGTELSVEEKQTLGKNLNKDIEKEYRQERELLAQVNEIVRRRRKLEDERNKLRTQVQTELTLLEGAKRKLTTFNSERAMREKLKEQSEEFDSLTNTAYWREFAFNHQIEGAKRLASAKRGILGDKRGLGKTLTSIIWSDMVEAKKVIIFAPKDVLQNFKREIEKWAPHRNVAVLGGMNKTEREMFLGMLSTGVIDQCLILCNYEAWRKDASLIKLIISVCFDTVVIDEAHNIKARNTSAYKGIRSIVYAENECSLCGGTPEQVRDSFGKVITRCSECLYEPQEFGEFCSVKNVLPMTGTPILNKPQDLWTLLHLVDRILFPSENDFLREYCTKDPWTNRWKFKYGGEEALTKRLGFRFVARDRKSAGVTIPPQTIQRHYVEMDKSYYADQYRVMQEIANFGAIKMAEDVKLDVMGILAELTRRRQAITWAAGIKIEEVDDEGKKTGRILYEAPVTQSIKIDKCMDLATEIIEEDRIVIFSQFKEALKEIERRFIKNGVSVIRYDGDLRDNRAQVAQLDFDGKTAATHPQGTDCSSDCPNWNKSCGGYQFQVILCQYKKGGVGINLNAARQMIILDREWGPGKEDQAQGRIDRLDNKHETVVHTIHIPGTIDSFMDELIEEKSNMIEGFESSVDITEKLNEALRSGDML